MAQTRKKRRSKHRGTAAGTIESRGRPGRKLSEAERKKGARSSAGGSRAAGGRVSRLDQVPTWRSAFLRALVACGLLFIFTRVGFGPDVGILASLLLCVVALAIYVPLGYATDMFVYRRRQRRKLRA